MIVFGIAIETAPSYVLDAMHYRDLGYFQGLLLDPAGRSLSEICEVRVSFYKRWYRRELLTYNCSSDCPRLAIYDVDYTRQSYLTPAVL